MPNIIENKYPNLIPPLSAHQSSCYNSSDDIHIDDRHIPPDEVHVITDLKLPTNRLRIDVDLANSTYARILESNLNI